jgi:hypothetical protein
LTSPNCRPAGTRRCTGDKFFHRKWAYWLRDTIPGASDVVEIDGGRLFFPDERASELTAALSRHWDKHP